MAFLRLSRRRVATFKAAKRQSLEEQRDDWIAQRQAAMRSRSVEMLGKTFATKRKAAEYGKRLVEGNFRDGKPHEARSFKARGKASMAVEPKPRKAESCYRVRNVNGVWRRYVGAEPDWRWVSDHATMEDALAGRNALE